MVDKLEVGKTYKCIDLEGYYKSDRTNKKLYEDFFSRGVITLDLVEGGDGWKDGKLLIDRNELHLFEIVESTTEKPHLWNGKEELALGMELTVINSHSTKFYLKEINPVMGGKEEEVQYLLEEVESGRLHLQYEEDLRTLLPCPKETFIKDITNQWRGQGIDYMYDTSASIEKVASMCYDKLKGDVDE